VPELTPPTAVLLDLDGTLVHTVPTRIDAWVAALAEFGIPADRDHIASMIGSDGRQLARDAGERVGIPMRRERAAEIDFRHGEIFVALNTAPAVLPGVHDFVRMLHAAAIPWAIATSSGGSDQVRPDGCWCVGDATWDMLAARAAGMIAVGVTAGSAVRAPRLSLAGAHLVVRTLDDLVPLVGDPAS
jgi:phosphoglycolate phosphatase-like HAD superfamily hydrolase